MSKKRNKSQLPAAPVRPGGAAESPAAAPAMDAAAELPPSRAGRIAVGALMGLYVAVYLTICVIKWRSFLYDDFDLAIYAQACRGVLHGTLYSPILNVNLLGNHMSLLIVPIALVYAVAQSPVTLLVLQTVVLALGALPVYALARREIRSEFIAVACAALYLLYPALGYSNLYQFHPETLTASTLLFAFYFLRAGRFWWMTAFAVISLLTKEDVPIVVGAMGLYALCCRGEARLAPAAEQGVGGASSARARHASPLRNAATLAGLALVFLVLAFVIVMPAVNKGEVQMQRIYGQWGPTTGQALVAMAKHPVRAGSELFTTPVGTSPDGPYYNDAKSARYDTTVKRQYYLQMLMPVMFLALLSPLTLAIALPAIAQHLLSGRSNDHTIVYHYTALVTPFVVSAAVLGLRNLLSLVAGRRPGPLPVALMNAKTPAAVVGALVAGVALALAVTCQVLFGPVAGLGRLQAVPAPERNLPTPYESAQARHMRGMLARLPAEGAVAAGFRFMPHVVNRDVVYSVHHVYKGTHTMSDKPYAIPEDVAAMALDADSWIYLTFSRPDGGGRLRRLLEVNRLAPVEAAGDALLFLRDAKEPITLWETGDFTPDSRRRVDYNGQLLLLGWDALPAAAAPGGTLPVRTLWRRSGDVNRYYLSQFAFFGPAGERIFLMPRRIGYTIYPPQDWPRERVVREHYNLIVPSDVTPGAWAVMMRVWEGGGGAPMVSRPDDPEAAKAGGFIPLGRVAIQRYSAK